MHFNGQRQVIGQMCPRLVAEDSRVMAAGIAQVDPVEAQQRESRRIRLGRAPVMTFEGLVQVIAAGEGGVALELPVIEIAGDNHRCIFGQRFKQLTEELQL